MMNTAIIAGRIVKDLELHETENGYKVAELTLAVPRSFKNMDGQYDTDFLPCKLWSIVAENTAEYCKKGDLVAIKGRLQSTTYEENEIKHNGIELIAEKVSFLSTKRPEADE